MMSFKNLFSKITGQRFYLTKEGMQNIKKEYENLKALKIAKTKGEMPQFLHSDDLNPEYISLQNDLTLLDSEITDFENILKNAELIKPPPKEKRNTIQLGAKVLLEIDGQKDEFTLVGTIEANPSLGKISIRSPVGKALLGHKVGEEVIVSSPIRTTYKIKKIEYS